MTTAFVILILLIGAALMLRHLQRALFYPRANSMPDVVDESIDAMLKRFENTLERYAPHVLVALQPGLADERVREIESRYRLRLTDDLRALYRWRNGSAPEQRAALIPGHWFAPLEYAAEQREGQRQQVLACTFVQRIVFWCVAGHRTTWISVVGDVFGDGYFYDPARRRRSGNFFYHLAQDHRYRFFPSLVNFLAGAIECYETGIYASDQDGQMTEDYDRSFELWARYSAWPSA